MIACQGCGEETTQRLCCPRCNELGRSSFFCSQQCFHRNWSLHSRLHRVIKETYDSKGSHAVAAMELLMMTTPSPRTQQPNYDSDESGGMEPSKSCVGMSTDTSDDAVVTTAGKESHDDGSLFTASTVVRQSHEHALVDTLAPSTTSSSISANHDQALRTENVWVLSGTNSSEGLPAEQDDVGRANRVSGSTHQPPSSNLRSKQNLTATIASVLQSFPDRHGAHLSNGTTRNFPDGSKCLKTFTSSSFHQSTCVYVRNIIVRLIQRCKSKLVVVFMCLIGISLILWFITVHVHPHFNASDNALLFPSFSVASPPDQSLGIETQQTARRGRRYEPHVSVGDKDLVAAAETTPHRLTSRRQNHNLRTDDATARSSDDTEQPQRHHLSIVRGETLPGSSDGVAVYRDNVVPFFEQEHNATVNMPLHEANVSVSNVTMPQPFSEAEEDALRKELDVLQERIAVLKEKLEGPRDTPTMDVGQVNVTRTESPKSLHHQVTSVHEPLDGTTVSVETTVTPTVESSKVSPGRIVPEGVAILGLGNHRHGSITRNPRATRV